MVTYTRPSLCKLFLISDNIVAAPAAAHQYVSCYVVSGMRREMYFVSVELAN